jgi:NADH-quinone oxidoreductase subunit N
LLAYTFMTLGSFGVVTLVSRIGDGHTALDDFRGLSKRRPVLAFTFTVFLLAQAGVPLTSGFLAKFRVIGAAASAHSYALAIIAMLSTVIGAFLYLKVVVAMYLTGDETYDRDRVPVPPGAFVALTVALAITLVLGFFPSFVIDLSRHAVTG